MNELELVLTELSSIEDQLHQVEKELGPSLGEQNIQKYIAEVREHLMENLETNLTPLGFNTVKELLTFLNTEEFKELMHSLTKFLTGITIIMNMPNSSNLVLSALDLFISNLNQYESEILKRFGLIGESPINFEDLETFIKTIEQVQNQKIADINQNDIITENPEDHSQKENNKLDQNDQETDSSVEENNETNFLRALESLNSTTKLHTLISYVEGDVVLIENDQLKEILESYKEYKQLQPEVNYESCLVLLLLELKRNVHLEEITTPYLQSREAISEEIFNIIRRNKSSFSAFLNITHGGEKKFFVEFSKTFFGQNSKHPRNLWICEFIIQHCLNVELTMESLFEQAIQEVEKYLQNEAKNKLSKRTLFHKLDNNKRSHINFSKNTISNIIYDIKLGEETYEVKLKDILRIYLFSTQRVYTSSVTVLKDLLLSHPQIANEIEKQSKPLSENTLENYFTNEQLESDLKIFEDQSQRINQEDLSEVLDTEQLLRQGITSKTGLFEMDIIDYLRSYYYEKTGRKLNRNSLSRLRETLNEINQKLNTNYRVLGLPTNESIVPKETDQVPQEDLFESYLKENPYTEEEIENDFNQFVNKTMAKNSLKIRSSNRTIEIASGHRLTFEKYEKILKNLGNEAINTKLSELLNRLDNNDSARHERSVQTIFNEEYFTKEQIKTDLQRFIEASGNDVYDIPFNTTILFGDKKINFRAYLIQYGASKLELSLEDCAGNLMDLKESVIDMYEYN